MLSPLIVLSGWILQSLACFYLIRFISNATIRCILTLVPCVVLTHITARDLPAMQMTSMLFTTFSWFASIRFFHFTVLSPNQYPTYKSFILKVLWMFFPIVPSSSFQHQQLPIVYESFIAITKLILNHWLYRWLLTCPGSDSYVRVSIYFIFAVTYTFLADIQSIIVRLITRNKYILLPSLNFPFLSLSVREFWGKRYNQLVCTVFRESIFQPVRQFISSATLASLIVFFISGLLHLHLLFAMFKDYRSFGSTMSFFLLHGLVCTLEANTSFQLPKSLSWLFTQLFLLSTASLQLGPFTRIGPQVYIENVPPFFEQNLIPKLPIPNFCPS